MTDRKRHVTSTVEDTVDLIAREGILTEAEVAERLDVSSASARRHLEGGVARGLLSVDEHDEEGHPVPRSDWRYCLSEEAEGDRADARLLAEWRGGRFLSTLDLRSAQHAAEREGATEDARKLASLIETREAKGDTG